MVTLRNCQLANFDVGLRVRAGGRVIIASSEIENCNIGILVEQHARVEMSQTVVRNCKENAIVVEMDDTVDQETSCGGIELLKSVPETFEMDDCRCYGNSFSVKLEYC